ncbi:DNA repair protein SWI5 homolog [Aplochiton taeniatus]
MDTVQHADTCVGAPDTTCSTTPETKNISFHIRTPLSRSKKVNSSFKSPLQTSSRAPQSPEVEVEELQRTLEQLNQEINLLEKDGLRVEELDLHIDLLHEYNDVKDVGQTLLGRLAALRGTTTRELYSHFGLELED